MKMAFRPQPNLSAQRPPFPLPTTFLGGTGGGLLPTPGIQAGLPPPLLGGILPMPAMQPPVPAPPPPAVGAVPPSFPTLKSSVSVGSGPGLLVTPPSNVQVSSSSGQSSTTQTTEVSTPSSSSGTSSTTTVEKKESINHDIQEQKSQLTTVFVGNITERASDALVRQILMKCGYIINWKRVQGANGRLQAFGFCEYSSPDAGLRAMRLLNGLELGEKTLLVKVDAKTRAQLDEYKKEKRKEKQATTSTSHDEDRDYDVEEDQETKTLDDTCKKEILSLLTQHADVLSGKYEDSLPYMKKSHSGSADNLEGLDMDDARKSLVSKEIRMFRESYKDDQKEKDKKERDRDRDRDRRDRDRGGRRDRDRRDKPSDDRDRRDRAKELDKRDLDDDGGDDDVKKARRGSREREPEERAKYSEREREKEKERERNSRIEREKEYDRQRERESERDRKGIRERSAKEDDIDEEYERRRSERIRRERDQSYSERLKEWEARERKRARDYEKSFAKDAKKKEEEEEERQHLQDFLEDYDDDRDDPKYYRGTALARRMRDREIEVESDSRDKQREMEEIDEILRRRMAEPSGDKENESPNQLLIKRESDLDMKRESPLHPYNPSMKPTFSAVKAEPDESRSPSPSSRSSPAGPDSARDSPMITVPSMPMKRESNGRERDLVSDDNSLEPPTKKTTFGFGMKISNISQPNSKKLESVFSATDEDGASESVPKKKLTRLDEEEEGAKSAKDKDPSQMTAEEKKKTIRNLIEKIPTGKDELFAYPLKWDMVDQPLVEKRIRPWINKKIFEYIGEEEPTLVEFICEKIVGQCSPKAILEDVAMVLDDEAEVFVVKMWRLLIYETDAKSLGLVK